MHGRSCAIVLIGAETANRKWVPRNSHGIRKGLFHLHPQVPRPIDKPSAKGRNPFDYVKFSNGTSLACQSLRFPRDGSSSPP